MRFPLAVSATCAALLAVAAAPSSAMAELIDSDLPVYRPQEDVSGPITLMGSRTMSNVAGIWMDTFNRYHPEVRPAIAVPGSRAAVDAVIDGKATFGLLSRSITQAEVDKFVAKFGYRPTVLDCCKEHMAIYVSEKNPVKSLTLEQVRAIFSGQAKTWGELGLTGPWASQPILTHGRGETTGSRVFLEQTILRGAGHKVAREHSDYHDMVTAIADPQEARGIGYAGLIYKVKGIRAVPIAVTKDSQAVAIDSLAAARGQYPIMRPLQLVVNQPPKGKLPTQAAEFIKYVFSLSGQEDVIRSGFHPISAAPARMALDATGLGTAR